MKEEQPGACMNDLKAEIERLRSMIKDLENCLVENVAEMAVSRSMRRDEDRTKPGTKIRAKKVLEGKKQPL